MEISLSSNIRKLMPSVKLTLRLKVGKPEAGWIIRGRTQRRFYIPPGNKRRERDRRFYPSFTWCSTFLRSLENGSEQVRPQVTPATDGQHAAEPERRRLASRVTCCWEDRLPGAGMLEAATAAHPAKEQIPS